MKFHQQAMADFLHEVMAFLHILKAVVNYGLVFPLKSLNLCLKRPSPLLIIELCLLLFPSFQALFVKLVALFFVGLPLLLVKSLALLFDGVCKLVQISSCACDNVILVLSLFEQISVLLLNSDLLVELPSLQILHHSHT